MKHSEIISRMTVEEKCYLLSGKDIWSSRSLKRLGIPNLMMSDGPHGVRKQEGSGDHLGLHRSVPATCFPTAATIANSWDPKLGECIGQSLGEEAASQGIHVLLGPGINIKRSPLCGRNFEYFSEDPYLSGKLATGYVRGIQSVGVAACPKHFAANSQELRRMASDSILDERTLREIYLEAFEITVKESDPKAIMSSYNRVNGEYASENKHLLREILKDEWGFRGYTVTDWGGSNDHSAGVLAGTHLEMPTSGGDSDSELLAAVRSGKVAESWIDIMVDEFLDVVLSVTAEADMKKGQLFDKAEHHLLARKAAEESIVLLKNDGNLLPLATGTKVALIGDFADVPRYQGAGSSMVNPTCLESVKDIMDRFNLVQVGFAKGYNRCGGAIAEMEEEACKLAGKAEVVLLCMGLTEILESEGLDRNHMRIPKNQEQLLRKLFAINQNIVVLFSAGSPVEMPWLSQCRALLHGYLGGQAGASAMLRVVTGQISPSGKLAETYPLRYEDTSSQPYFPSKERTSEYRESIYVGYRYFETVNKPVLFPFGYGLSYTTFEYKNLAANDKAVTLTVTNTGKTDGAEIVQLYVSAKCNGVFRPAKELKGFTKVFIKAGESEEVTIALDEYAFRYFNVKTNKYEVEEGEYELLIGASSADIRLRKTVYVSGTDAPLPYNKELLPNYYTGNIKNISDAEYEALLGHTIPDGKWNRGGPLDINDAICQMHYAKSRVARITCKVLLKMLENAEAKGTPDLNILFIYNMTFRGIAKMTGGMITMEMVNGILDAINGHFFRGFGRIIKGFVVGRKQAKKAKGME